MEYALRNKIEFLRIVMVELAKRRGSFLDVDVIWISQELDKEILKAQLLKKQKNNVLKKAQ